MGRIPWAVTAPEPRIIVRFAVLGRRVAHSDPLPKRKRRVWRMKRKRRVWRIPSSVTAPEPHIIVRFAVLERRVTHNDPPRREVDGDRAALVWRTVNRCYKL